MGYSENEEEERGIGENNSEAIEFLKEIKKKYHNYHISMPISNRKGAIRHISLHFGLDIIIELLKRGEINQKIIDKMRKEKFDVWVSLPGSFTNLPDFVNDIEEEVIK